VYEGTQLVAAGSMLVVAECGKNSRTAPWALGEVH
jgi:hypothetical protein